MSITNGSCCGQAVNLGVPNCLEQFGLANGLAIGKLVTSAGVVNSIDISVAITTGFSSLFTSSDTSIRLAPVSGLRNIDFPQEGNQYDTDNTAQKDFLRKGILSFSGEKRGGNNVYASKLDKVRCSRNGTYIMTDEGVVGIKISDWALGTHAFQRIPMSAFAAEWNPKKGDAVEKTMVTFDFPATLEVGELWMIPYSELGMTADAFALAGLQDVNFSETTVVTVGLTDSFSSVLITDYGTGILGGQNVTGLVTADFSAVNRTSGAAIVLTSATEIPDIKTDFVYPNQPTTDVVRISIITASGFDGYIDVTTP